MDLTFLGTASANPTPSRGVSSIVFRNVARPRGRREVQLMHTQNESHAMTAGKDITAESPFPGAFDEWLCMIDIHWSKTSEPNTEGNCWMFDCGEGTQIQLMRSQLKAARLTKIFITHLHGDHLFGLPGLMCTISQGFSEADRDVVIMLYGPVGLRRYVRVNLDLSRSEMSYSYVVHELISPEEELPQDWETWHPEHKADLPHHPNEKHDGRDIEADNQGRWKVTEDDNCVVWAAPISHRIPCFGYVIEQKPVTGRFGWGSPVEHDFKPFAFMHAAFTKRLDVVMLRSKGIPPGPLYGKLKAGETVSYNGITVKPEEVVGPPRPGKKIVILGDTKESSKMTSIATNADIMIHEATVEDELKEVCISRGHSTPSMAGEFARSLNVKQLILTHFSQRYKALSHECQEGEVSVSKLVEQAKAAFQSDNVIAADDLAVIKVS